MNDEKRKKNKKNEKGDEGTEKKMVFVKSAVLKRIYNVTDQTIGLWRRKGAIKSKKLPGGSHLYAIPETELRQGDNFLLSEKKKACYCRVSSSKQKDDLDRQIAFMRTKFPSHEIISDVGSGINWKRGGLKTILGLALNKQLTEVVVAHRDRLCRFAFELIEWILECNGVRLVVLNEKKNSSESELAEDLLSIIHVFSCRQMGRRRYNKTKSIEKNKVDGEEGEVE